jgi:hypothetical protein
MKTVELDDRLFAEAEEFAIKTGRTVTTVVEDAVRETLSSQIAKPPKRQFSFTTDTGRGVRPGVNLDSNAALLDLMEADSAPH